MSKPVIVVGGGFGGLAAAVRLAAAGLPVTLLEQQEQLGGKAGELRAGGFRFDTGPTVLTMPETLTDLFRTAGRELPLPLLPVAPLSRYLFPSGRVWDVYRDVAATTTQLSDDEARAYRQLLAEAERLYQAAAPTFVTGTPPTAAALLRYAVRHGLQAHPTRRLVELVRAAEPGSELEAFFLRFATYVGADPFRAPAVLHNVAWAELGGGSLQPRGGMAAIARALGAVAQELGADIRCGVRVTKLVRRRRKVVAVESDAGVFEAEAVVSNVDWLGTQRLLGRRPRREWLEPSLSGLVVLLGVRGHHEQLAGHTISFPSDYRAEFEAIRKGRYPADPTLYLHLSCRQVPEDAPPGHENWFVMANAPALPAAVATGARRQREVAAAERAYAERVTALLYQRGLLEPEQVLLRRYLGPRHLARLGWRGAIYGAAPNSLTTALRPSPRLPGIDNLVLAGGTVHPGGGVPLALLSGKEAARRLLARLGGAPLGPRPR